MIDQWFSEEVARLIQKSKRLVITDTDGEGKFLIDFLPKQYTIIPVATTAEEITARYNAEKNHANDRVIFYSKIPAGELSSLQGYVQTCGLIDLNDIDSYLRHILFSKLKKNTAISNSDLLIAAKVCPGKTIDWWKGVMDGQIKPLEVKDNILKLLYNPSGLKAEMDKSIWKSFSAEVYKLIDKPNTAQPADALAKEVSKSIFDKLVDGTITGNLLDIYYGWVDSKTYSQTLQAHLSAYAIPADADFMSSHPDHCFDALDKKVMSLLSKRIAVGANISDILSFIDKRLASIKAADRKPEWLRCIKTVFEYRSNNLEAVSNLKEFAAYYQNNFAKVDTAMRKLYVAWLSDEKILRPIQEYYENLNKVVLDKWYSLIRQYEQSQLMALETIFNDNDHCAIIVGDGLRLEIAEVVADLVHKSHYDYIIERSSSLCALPSITEIGMSFLYGLGSEITSAQERINHLKGKFEDLEVKQLEKLSDSDTANKLVLCFGDIDQVGEKKQLQGLKDIDAYEGYLADAIGKLLNMGYSKVFMTTDHGFVITGILDESDKITPPSGTDMKVEERYVVADHPLSAPELIEMEGAFGTYRYAYFAKTDKPFKTKGAYGYAHGGLTPQECIIPMYSFASNAATYSIGVTINNKAELKSVASNYYKLKIQASGDASSIFNNEVKVLVQHFVNGTSTGVGAIQTLKAGATLELEFELPKGGEEKIVIVDSQTKKQYDFCTVKKSDDRDLGGLL